MVIYKKIRFWLPIILMTAIAVIVWNILFSRIEVKGYEVVKKELEIGVTATSTGTVKADREIRLSAQRIGRIARLYVEEGDKVSTGGKVADLEHEEAEQRLHSASAAHQRVRAELEALKLGYASFKTDIATNIEKARSILDETGTRYKRFLELKNKGFISQIDLDAVKREYDVAKSSFTSALASEEQIKSKDEEIKAFQAAVEQSLRDYNIAKIIYDYSFIRSPMNGIIISRPVKTGDTAQLGALIANVVSPDSLYIESFIDEADVAKISIGQPVKITMDAYTGKSFNGEVSMISPVVLGGKQEARTFEVRVRFKEKDIVVKPGMSADVEVIVDRLQNVLVIPSQAIIEKEDKRFVYVEKRGKAELQQITTGLFNWNYYEVTEGIKEGDVLIMNLDAPELKNGARIKVLKTAK